jgi:hypothetical protein
MVRVLLARALLLFTLIASIWKATEHLLLRLATRAAKVCRNFAGKVLRLIGFPFVASVRIGREESYKVTAWIFRFLASFFIRTLRLAGMFARFFHRHPEAFIFAHALGYGILALTVEHTEITSQSFPPSLEGTTPVSETSNKDLNPIRVVAVLERPLTRPSLSHPHHFAHLWLFVIQVAHYWTHVLTRKRINQKQNGKHCKPPSAQEASSRSDQL